MHCKYSDYFIPRPVVILIDVTILSPGSEVGGKLGNPAPFKTAAGGEKQQQQQQPGKWDK